MDYGTLQGIITILVMLAFVGIFAWAYSARRRDEFDEAANLVFTADELDKDSGEHKQ